MTVLLWLPFFFSAVLCYTAVIPDGIPSFERDAFNYIVALTSAEAEEDASQGAFVSETSSQRVVLTSAEGNVYSCAIPERPSTETVTSMHTTGTAEKSPFDFLAPLESACFKRIELWWTYKFCFGRQVRQYHDDKEESMKADYVLGFFDPTQKPDNEIREDIAGGKTVKYIRQLYTNGDVCDETNEKRTTEVRFVCEEQSQLSATLLASVTEGPTCHYTMNINSPLLCQHPAFKTQETTRVIVCERVENAKPTTTNASVEENVDVAAEDVDMVEVRRDAL